MALMLLLVSLAAPLRAQQEVGQVFASDAAVRGSVVLVSGGTSVLSGSQVTAGLSPARLQLHDRTGFLRICPKTNLSVAASGGGLLLGMSEGAVELRYSAAATTDTLITPDFRIQLTGPGDFRFAISVDKAGDTCIHALASDTASAIASETFGTGSYQVSPGRSVVFRNGKLGTVAQPTGTCGCPEPEPPAPPELAGERQFRLPTSATAPVASSGSTSKSAPVTTPPAAAANAASEHLEAEAPLVYHGDRARTDPFLQLIKLQTRSDNGLLAQLRPVVAPPPHVLPAKGTTGEKAKEDGLFHRIGRFFRRVFGS